MEKLTVLDFLCVHLGWQGGTIHQALQAVQDLPGTANSYPHKNHILLSLEVMEKSDLIDTESAGYDKLKNILK
jgi:hypothetical protein